MKNVINRALVAKKKVIFTLMLTLVSSVWMTSKAAWCMPAAQTDSGQFIRIGGSFQEGSMPPCPACLTIVLEGGWHYLASDDPQIVAILDTVSIGSFAIIEGYHYLERHADFINVTRIIFPETDIQQLSGEWEVSRETISSPTGDAGSSSFSIHDVNYTNYVIADNLIYKVVLDQASGYAHYSDAVPYTLEQKGDGTWLLTAEGKFDSTDPVEEGRPSPITIYQLTEDEMEWVYAANGGDEGPNYYYQYLKRYTGIEHLRINSLCDEWNVLYEAFSWPGGYRTDIFYLSTDTIINEQRYVKLVLNSDNRTSYKGAFREAENKNIYYYPAGSTHEYLLYAFNAQVGDTLSNLWIGGWLDTCPEEGWQGIVQSISNGNPRTFNVGIQIPELYGDNLYPLYWIEGVGSKETPIGLTVPPTIPVDIGTYKLLCAYKDGEQIYASQLSERFGCSYEGNNPPPVTDTIPVYSYTGDDPGSSTVDPVDPNQVVVILKGDNMTVKESSGDEINMELTYITKNAPSEQHTAEMETFTNSVSLKLTEEGSYTITLTNPKWNYKVSGKFDYPKKHEGIGEVQSDNEPCTKVLRDGQLLIRRGNKLYNLQGAVITE